MPDGIELSAYIAATPVIIGILVYVVKKALGDVSKRYLPLIAIVIGVIVSLIVTYYGKEIVRSGDYIQAILEGLVIGAAAVGYHEVEKRAFRGKIKKKPGRKPKK